ncbi:MAG: hypothetical protein SNJ79_03330 [Sphingomonadaceae bacterium]
MSAEHRFFLGYALAAAAVLIVGFAPSYALPLLGIDTPLARHGLPLVVHLHGIVFFGYLGLYVGQTWLAASGRAALHRRMGALAGPPMFAALLAVGVAIALWGPERVATDPAAVAFLAWLVGDILMIAVFMGGALLLRRDPGTHKRLMALAMAVMVAPGLGRIAGWAGLPMHVTLSGPPTLFALALVAFDLVHRGRLHRATAWGVPLLFVSQALRAWAMESPGWLPTGAAFLVSVQ